MFPPSARPTRGLGFLVKLLSALAASTIAHAHSVIHRDVAIIGGGASGLYAALRLRQMNHSVVVVESRPEFGGHTASYTVPGTNTHINYGAQGYGGDDEAIKRFFGFYNIPIELVKLSEVGFGNTRHVDFAASTELPDFRPDNNLTIFSQQVHKYPRLSLDTKLPTPVPEDLTLPFRDFVAKYGIQSNIYSLFFQTEGLGDLLSQTTYYVFKYLNPDYLDGQLPTSPVFYVTKNGFNQEIYLKAQADFGADALVSSRVTSAVRNGSGVVLTVRTPSGQKIIRASKLLVTMPPTLANMRHLGLDRHEHNIFSRFQAHGWYVGLVKAEGFADRDEFVNANSDSSNYNLPQLPALYQISPTAVKGIYLVRYGSYGYMNEQDIKSDIVATVERVRLAVLPSTAGLPPVTLLAYSSHYPFSLYVSPSDISGGFYNRLDGLQGHRDTWYTGAAFSSHTAAHVWSFTERLLPRLFPESNMTRMY
ncbi:FAD dependent oxidoreductase family protein [Metarhizium album ARSEF 1941]|uniref:FAD dependent oxidoreductase family protein n=1 Tax=Metarhizium album (strain ARSEF 1941) TaxID=1081103 RepID=A0A0B2WLS6_METAS|nr:FAD dependent oxidoreductase family protein [Metarhizium album ARSEF 1941]KHN94888.1 FAD dependent oxidoreductase family protein [Metarhizium album ARSEF 1941]